MIKKNESITIEKVGNGFMIRPEYNQLSGKMSSLEDMTVFNTLSQLSKFVKTHFAEKEEEAKKP